MGSDPELAGVRVTQPVPTRPAERATAEIGAAARSGALNLTGAAVSAVLGLLLTLAVTRLFSPSVAGVFFVAMTVFLIAEAVAGLGAGVGLVYTLARRRALGQVAGLRAVWWVAAGPALAGAVLVAAAVWFGAPRLAEQLVDEAHAAATAALRAVALFIPAAVLLHLAVSAIRGMGRTRPFVVIERFVRPALQLAAVATIGLGALGAAVAVSAAWAAPYLLAAVLAAAWAVRMRRRLERRAAVTPDPPTRTDWRSFWRFSAPRGGTGLAQVGLQRFDLILVAALLGPVAVALYVAASRFLVVGQLANQAIGVAAQHRFAALFATGDLATIRRLYQTTTAWLVLGTWPLLLLCLVFAEPVLGLFGPQYPAATAVMQLLCAAMLLGTGCGMVSMVLEMSGRSLSVLLLTIAALVVNVGLNLLLIPLIGLNGAAIAWLGAIAVNNLAPLWLLHRSYRLHPSAANVWVAVAATGVCFGLLPAAAAYWWGSPAAVGAALLGAVGYAAVLWRARRLLELTAFAAIVRRAGRVTAGAER
ncbi:polysaccharide biosynthesis C-terminal domain-containing protein [Natronosporangium hydrolyticum]|uniref:Polysaccharide biosynthesis C-terminal domain-containing protein n=1 Tax=Natronosporangium hydrolyticum TaxID=2811111 RepID=A0A895YDR1_9ACTN|nr:polysaccharide biosynthesis C-terminal domain-containing protein [Natronosporangium hydrolyticum]QSB15907.1 polysaccharide biosynthesis C-terminal domain-containing protein [Natronosporangium hydrolyticum]